MSEIIVPRGWRERLESIAGSRRDSIAVVALVAVVVVAGLLLWGRGGRDEIAPPAQSTSAEASAPGEGGVGATGVTAGVSGGRGPTEDAGEIGAGTGAVPELIYVHVSGAVRKPGLYELSAGARVADAVDIAGGPRRRADLSLVNLAQPLADGTKLDVPRRGENGATATGSTVPSTVPPTGTSVSGATPSAVVPLNTADQVALETIPGVGPVTAVAILEYRDQVGGFDSIEQLLEVSGIGPATLEEIRPHVTL